MPLIPGGSFSLERCQTLWSHVNREDWGTDGKAVAGRVRRIAGRGGRAVDVVEALGVAGARL